MGAHNAAWLKLSDAVLMFLTLGPWLPLHLSLASWVFLSCFALFYSILATCSSHTGMSYRLFSRWFAASSRHQQYPTIVALETQLGIKLLGYDPGIIFQGHFSCSRKLPGAFYFLILRGWNVVLFAKRSKISTGGCCRCILYIYIVHHSISYIYIQ